MQSTTVNELLSNGFTEDPLIVKSLQRAFAIPFIFGVGAFVFGFALVLMKDSVGVGISLVVGSLCFLLLMVVCMYRSRPKSRHTGTPLLKYKNSSPDPGVVVELIYVCLDSKTFSRRVYLMRGFGPAGA
jgi:hypothetical protein